MARATVRPLLPKRLGHSVIDSDHMEIAQCWFHTARCLPIQFPYLIARMKKLMRAHFAREEQIMHDYGSALCACHQSEHNALLSFCDTAAQLAESNWTQAQFMLRREFPRLLREHIICMDQMVVMCINTGGGIGHADPACAEG